MKELTLRQEEVLEFIIEYHVSFDKPPSYQEIADVLGVTKRTAFDHVKALSRKGYIKAGTIAEGIKTILVEVNRGEE